MEPVAQPPVQRPRIELEESTYAVRPYAVVGGRTKTTDSIQLPVETLIESFGGHEQVGLTPERRRIIELTSSDYLSVAELSAHVHLPVGVIRILVTDLAEVGKIKIHAPTPATIDPASNLSVLESVLNGISAL